MKTASASIGARATASFAAESASALFPAAAWESASVWYARPLAAAPSPPFAPPRPPSPAHVGQVDARLQDQCGCVVGALGQHGGDRGLRLFSLPWAKAISARRSHAGKASGAWFVMSVRTLTASSTRRVSR